MARTRKPGTLTRPWRLAVFALLIAGLLIAAFVSTGVGCILLVAALGLATFGSGPPKAGDGTYESGKGITG